MRDLGVQFDWDTFTVKTVSLTTIQQQYPKIFSSELGKIPGHQHKIRLSENALPVVKKLRTMPVAVQGQVSEQLK
ncbi:MAG: hypothetical protein GY696_24265 [Gammaproteobacteria bacterium]|nr:hypothetical protein [Gammaproteobacteria bacterium]